MRNTLLAVGIVALLGGLASCGGDDDRPSNIGDGPNTHGGSTAKGGSPSAGGEQADSGAGGQPADEGSGAGAGGAEGMEPDVLGPVVIITTPNEVTDPNDAGVLTPGDVKVSCIAKQSAAAGSRAVNASSVQLTLLSADGEVLDTKPGVPAGGAGEYSNVFPLTAVPSGRIGFGCSAQDLEQRLGTDRISALLDRGPTITIVTPEVSSAHPLSKPLDIEFTVEPAPLADGDQGAEVQAVTLDIGGTPIALGTAEESPGHYRLQVNLAVFNPAPNGVTPVTVVASNSRKPAPVTATATSPVLVDGDGPVLEVTSPLPGSVVGGNVRLTFKATDSVSGVDPDSVVVSLNMVDNRYQANDDKWSYSNGVFAFEFDSRQVTTSKVQITVNVAAKDKVGNSSPGGSAESVLLWMDNFPPAVDLDPLNIRSVTVQNECSISFDPVGSRAKNDLDHAVRAGDFRAFVWEQTNSDPEIKTLHFSGTNQGSARIYLEQDNAVPLLTDKDDDGFCDDVRDPDSNDSLGLNPIPKTLGPWYRTDDALVAPTPAALKCTTKDAPKPKQLCTAETSDMWQVVEHGTREPAVYAVAVASPIECTGTAWEFGGKLDADGWVCFAARVVDQAGNVGISRPLRLCVDDNEVDGSPPCKISSIAPPSCTDGCKPPPRIGEFGVLLQ